MRRKHGMNGKTNNPWGRNGKPKPKRKATNPWGRNGKPDMKVHVSLSQEAAATLLSNTLSNMLEGVIRMGR